MEQERIQEVEKYIARDVSWLSFNYRVLKEAADASVPLLERLRFLAIYSSNLDEFFRVRVADIRSLIRIGKKKINKSLDIKPKKVLKAINEEVNRQLEEYGTILREQVLPSLEKEGLVICNADNLSPQHRKESAHFFKIKVMPYLQPYIEGYSKRKPFLNNQGLYFAVKLVKQSDQTSHYGYLNIPSDKLPRFLGLSKLNDQHCFVMLDDVIKDNLSMVFPGYEVLESKSIKLNKDADLQIEDEYSGDLVEKIRKQIEKRDLGVPSRFLYDQSMSEDLLGWLVDRFYLHEDDLIPGGTAHNLNDYFQLPNAVGEHLEYPRFPSLEHPILKDVTTLLGSLESRDHLLHFPYQSYDYVLQFFNEAAIHPEVTEIKVAFYRMASNSLIGEALVSAANNGKDVMVFMEVKARFDEENNLKWAKRFQEAGIKVIYSIPGLKVHAKIALVTKSNGEGGRRYAFFGTGNLNEKTAKIYSDHGLLTSDELMTKELEAVFKFLYRRTQPHPFQKILVSQFNMMDRFIELIDYEIGQAREGNASGIVIKLNNLEEKRMIDKLYEASTAGVKIKMLVRGICCLRPGLKGVSENIEVRRIVDRYLEHARVFIFHHTGEERIYLGSADWMNRNLYSRIEVAFPITDPQLKSEVKEIVDLQLSDNVKGVLLGSNMENIPISNSVGESIRAQFDAYHNLNK